MPAYDTILEKNMKPLDIQSLKVLFENVNKVHKKLNKKRTESQIEEEYKKVNKNNSLSDLQKAVYFLNRLA